MAELVSLRANSNNHSIKYFHYNGANPFAGKSLVVFTAAVSGHTTFKDVRDIIVNRVTLTND